MWMRWMLRWLGSLDMGMFLGFCGVGQVMVFCLFWGGCIGVGVLLLLCVGLVWVVVWCDVSVSVLYLGGIFVYCYLYVKYMLMIMFCVIFMFIFFVIVLYQQDG